MIAFAIGRWVFSFNRGLGRSWQPCESQGSKSAELISWSQMRIQIDIPELLYRKLETKAADERRSVKELIVRGIETELKVGARGRRRRFVTLPLIRSKMPGTVELDNARIFEAIPFP